MCSGQSPLNSAARLQAAWNLEDERGISSSPRGNPLDACVISKLSLPTETEREYAEDIARAKELEDELHKEIENWGFEHLLEQKEIIEC